MGRQGHPPLSVRIESVTQTLKSKTASRFEIHEFGYALWASPTGA
jgi:hypothetical protein